MFVTQVKRGFVVLQRMLSTCRPHIVGEKAEEAADAAQVKEESRKSARF
jgi:hypothetical protein